MLAAAVSRYGADQAGYAQHNAHHAIAAAGADSQNAAYKACHLQAVGLISNGIIHDRRRIGRHLSHIVLVIAILAVGTLIVLVAAVLAVGALIVLVAAVLAVGTLIVLAAAILAIRSLIVLVAILVICPPSILIAAVARIVLVIASEIVAVHPLLL